MNLLPRPSSLRTHFTQLNGSRELENQGLIYFLNIVIRLMMEITISVKDIHINCLTSTLEKYHKEKKS